MTDSNKHLLFHIFCWLGIQSGTDGGSGSGSILFPSLYCATFTYKTVKSNILHSITLSRGAQNMDGFLRELGFCYFCLTVNQMIGLTFMQCNITYMHIHETITLVQSIFKEK